VLISACGGGGGGRGAYGPSGQGGGASQYRTVLIPVRDQEYFITVRRGGKGGAISQKSSFQKVEPEKGQHTTFGGWTGPDSGMRFTFAGGEGGVGEPGRGQASPFGQGGNAGQDAQNYCSGGGGALKSEMFGGRGAPGVLILVPIRTTPSGVRP
jgi:hypothetical protein